MVGSAVGERGVQPLRAFPFGRTSRTTTRSGRGPLIALPGSPRGRRLHSAGRTGRTAPRIAAQIRWRPQRVADTFPLCLLGTHSAVTLSPQDWPDEAGPLSPYPLIP